MSSETNLVYETRTVTAAPGRSKQTRSLLVVMSCLILLAGVVGVVVWRVGAGGGGSPGPEPTAAPHTSAFPVRVRNLMLSSELELKIVNGSDVKLLIDLGKGGFSAVPRRCNSSSASDVNACLEWENEARLRIIYNSHNIDQRLGSALDCYEISWEALRCVDQVLTDCVNVSVDQWYGGYADKHQYWPFQKNTRSLRAYQVNDSYVGEIGGVVERYFFSTAGVGMLIDHDVPLYFSLNDPDQGQMCFTAKYETYPYVNVKNVPPVLKYKLCQAANVKDVHLKMTELFIDKPTGTPDEMLFKRPIWSTWAQYKKDINQSTVLEFANDIIANNFSYAQIEIDDDWTPAYGDMDFNTAKFPDARQMIKDLNDLGFRVTLWVHPFFNADSMAFQVAALNRMLVRQLDSPAPMITPWWDGPLAGILDVSNRSAVDWFLLKLNYMKATYNISSFKFDAGETSWAPHIYSQANVTLNPAEAYPMKWVQLAAEADPTFHQEVRVGYKTQKYPIFVRMMDKGSNWGHDNAFKSIIPCVLTYGLLGYPFVLPDMIGGNAYNGQPDPELYVRWLQLNVFLPGMQYSITPWHFNDTIVDIARTFTEMRENFSSVLIKFARESTRTGEPIIRPLWWMDPNDQVTWTIEDEFLVGDEILVAPVMEKGARSRDIYFPRGNWKNELRNTSDVISGPKWVQDYKVDIDELAYFMNIS
ncbi:MYORG-like protein [Mya arenaria]|uniref:MYORG-like protein n=1 Tax=Mya arenaria TaxID=6604 RepID=A0ABY7F236_MYAAR|nr:myogenesis-regulating glycosidase-like [Mya arenaria]WAR14813.1 MYORG-like protein [Mya arenaria]